MDSDVEEVIKSIEAAFDVEFKEGEIGNYSTIEHVYNALYTRFDAPASDRCLTSIVFWRLRRAMMQVLELPKGSIKPSTEIQALIHQSDRRRTWSLLSKALDLKLPGLEYPQWYGYSFLIVAFAPSIWAMYRGHKWWWALLVAAPLIGMLLFNIAKPLAIAVPQHSRTVGETAQTMCGLNYAKLSQQLGMSNSRELWEALRYVVMDMTGAESSWISSDTRLLDLVDETLLRGQA